MGIDPMSKRDADRAAARADVLRTVSFKFCLDGLLASRGDGWREKHLKQWENSMATYAKPLMGVNVADIDVSLTLRCIEPQWKRAPVTMDRVRSRIGEVLGWAQTRGHRPPGPLPTLWKGHLDQLLTHPSKLAPTVNHPAMKYGDVSGLYGKLIASDGIAEACLAFTILTATRSQEARGARWDEIDAAGIWTVPPERMKRRKAHRVPLSGEALKLIAKLPRTGPYLFSIKGGKPVVAMSLRKALHRQGGDGFTVHGFRSALRDWGSEKTNTPREILEMSLAHAVGNAAEQAYARSDGIAKRGKLMEQWATFLTASPASDNVVAMRA